MGLFKAKGKHAQGAHAQAAPAQPELTADSLPTIEKGAAEAPEKGAAEAPEKDAIEAPEKDAIEAPEITVASASQSDNSARKPENATPAALPVDFGKNAAAPVDAHPYAPVNMGASELSVDPSGAVTVDGVVLRKKRNAGKVVGITFGIIIGVLLVAYIAGIIVFMGRFFPRTSIVGNDISMKTNDEVIALLDEKANDYKLNVAGTGFTYDTTGSDIGLAVDSKEVVNAMHADMPVWAWPYLLFQDEHDESGMLKVTYKSSDVNTNVTNAVNAFNETGVDPVDATIAYDDATKKFKVVAEVPGTKYDSTAVIAAMDDAITSLNPSVKLTSEELIQPKVFSTDERLTSSAELASGMVSAHVTLTMNGQPTMEITGANLSQFVHLDDKMNVTFDEAGLDQWITDLANGLNTVGTERTYTRPDGKVITVSGGAYGWSSDAPALKDQLMAAIKSGQTTSFDIPCEQTAQVFTAIGQPDWGNRYIDVDLSEQYVRFYGDDGSLIWESACISGTPDGEHNTWPGVWYITNKQSPSKLIGYLPNGQKEYETTVEYWMAFEGNGIGLHDATWQPGFGGDMYASGYGSHGCVNLSYDAAAELYSLCAVGDVVIAHF